jgi:hypothetical protein
MLLNGQNKRHVRILVRLTPDEDGYPPVQVEGLWAIPRADGNYILDNIPFYATGIAPGDEVSVRTSANGEVWLIAVIKAGGRSVFRIHAKKSVLIEEIRSSLLDLGCPSEIDAKTGLVAIEVPINCNIAPVLDFLMSGQDTNRFDFEEGVLRHSIPN